MIAAGARPLNRAELRLDGDRPARRRVGHRRLPPGGDRRARRAPAGDRRRRRLGAPGGRRAAARRRGADRASPAAAGSPVRGAAPRRGARLRRRCGGVRRASCWPTGWCRSATSTAPSSTASARSTRSRCDDPGTIAAAEEAGRRAAERRACDHGGRMRVRSPIGDLPFKVTAIRRDGRELVIHGELGAWRSEVRVGADDVKAVRAAGRRRRRGSASRGDGAPMILIGVDQGTTGTRTVAFDERLEPVADAYRRVTVTHPQPGWISKDADEVVGSVAETVAEVVAAVGGAGAVDGDRPRQRGRDGRRLGSGHAAEPVADGGGLGLPALAADRRPAGRRTAPWSRSAAACRSTRTSRPPRSAGCSRTCPPSRPRRGSARSTATSRCGSATARAPTRPPPPARSCRRWRRPAAGIRSCATCSASTPRALPDDRAVDR